MAMVDLVFLPIPSNYRPQWPHARRIFSLLAISFALAVIGLYFDYLLSFGLGWHLFGILESYAFFPEVIGVVLVTFALYDVLKLYSHRWRYLALLVVIITMPILYLEMFYGLGNLAWSVLFAWWA
jgi:hypothetical protein